MTPIFERQGVPAPAAGMYPKSRKIAALLCAMVFTAVSGIAEAGSHSKHHKAPVAAKADKPVKAGRHAKEAKSVKTAKQASPAKHRAVRASQTQAPKARHHKAAPRVERAVEAAPVRRAARADAMTRVAEGLDANGGPKLASNAFMVQDLDSGKVLLQRNAQAVVPIASITKLMTAMVVLDAHLPLNETLTISDSDTDKLKSTSSRLTVGVSLPRQELIHLALMSSENRAAASLARNYPGGFNTFVAAMNRKARELGLTETVFHDSTGLNPNNVSSARDLAKMVVAASHYPLIREFSTDDERTVTLNGRQQSFHNTNALVRSPDWQIGVSKTGFINEAGRCLVMQAWFANKPMVIVLLDSVGKFTRIADAQRVKRWLETATARGNLRSNAG